MIYKIPNYTGIKLLLLSSFIFLCLGLISAWNCPCTGWVSNIYTDTPLIFWISIFIAYIVGIGCLLYSHFYRPLPKYIQYISWILLFCAMVSVLFLTVIRGYKLLWMSEDASAHLGNLKQTIEAGITTEISYPGIYWETAFFSLVTGISPSKTISLFPFLMVLIGTIGIILLAKHILPNKDASSIAMIIALALPYGSTFIFFRPYDQCFAASTISEIGLLPLFLLMLCIAFTTSQKKMIIPLLIMNFAIVFYHPNVLVICIVVYITIILCTFYTSIRKLPSIKDIRLNLIALLFSLIGMFFIWTFIRYKGLIVTGIFKIFSTFNFYDKGSAKTLEMFDIATTAGYNIYTVFQVAGINILICLMLLIGGIIALKKYKKHNNYCLFLVAIICSISLCLVVLVTLLGNFVGEPSRFIRVPYIIGILATGLVISEFFKFLMNRSKVKNKLIHVGALFILILIICTISILAFHPSPQTMNPGYQTTQPTITAMETLLPRVDYGEIDITGYNLRQIQRYVHAIYNSPYIVGSYAYGYYHLKSATRSSADTIDPVPFHFGYDTQSPSISSFYPNGVYVIIGEIDRVYNKIYFPELEDSRFTENDFAHLSMDTGMNLIYNNGGVQCYSSINI